MFSFYKSTRAAMICGAVSAALFAGNSVASATPICQSTTSDPDGDGWGWENNQSCATGTTTTSVLQRVAVTDNGTPGCTNASSDTDNDGWGWENGRSCEVLSGTAQPANTVAGGNTNSGNPVCISPDSDPDGDGWGWENNASCAANTAISTESVARVNTAITTTPPAQTTTPYCSASHSDPDNDGWGWENNQSCIISASKSFPLKIMAVGDSITHGVRNQSSYRKPLNNSLTKAGCQYSFVGSQSTNYPTTGFTAAHEGYSGHTADHFLTGHNDASGSNQGIIHSMSAYNPDVVLLHIGTNDMRLLQSIDSTMSEIDLIISAIHQHNASATVLLANVIPWYLAAEQQVKLLGDRIESYVATLDNPLVKLVDVRSGYEPAMMIWDKAHPNSSGDLHIAAAFHNAYTDASLCGN